MKESKSFDKNKVIRNISLEVYLKGMIILKLKPGVTVGFTETLFNAR
jgi:hypothetical protein